MPMCPRPPDPITTHFVPAPSTGIAFFTAWIAVRPASASAAISAGCSDGSSLTTERALVSRYSAKPPARVMPGEGGLAAGARAGEEVRGEAAVAVDAGERAVLAHHVVAQPARAAQAARD